MPEGFRVGLSGFDEAKEAVVEAVHHYGALADELDRNTRALRDDESLVGGHGVTGHFQSLLAEFSREWLTTMDKFLEEERAFVTFLQGFAVRLEETQTSYRLADQHHAERFEQISRSAGER